MNPQKIAEALSTIQVGLGELAEALNDSPTPARAGGPEAGTGTPAPASYNTFDTADFEEPQPSFADASGDFAAPDFAIAEQGSEAVCPKHRVPYTDGAYGPYCKQRTDDPAWGKQKGDTMWCRITPKNAAQYLRVQAAA